MVQIHPDPPFIASGGFTGPSEFIDSSPNGAIAQLGERLPCTQEVSGSIPLSSTTYCLGSAKLEASSKDHPDRSAECQRPGRPRSIPLSSTTYCLDLENASDIEVIAK